MGSAIQRHRGLSLNPASPGPSIPNSLSVICREPQANVPPRRVWWDYGGLSRPSPNFLSHLGVSSLNLQWLYKHPSRDHRPLCAARNSLFHSSPCLLRPSASPLRPRPLYRTPPLCLRSCPRPQTSPGSSKARRLASGRHGGDIASPSIVIGLRPKPCRVARDSSTGEGTDLRASVSVNFRAGLLF